VLYNNSQLNSLLLYELLNINFLMCSFFIDQLKNSNIKLILCGSIRADIINFKYNQRFYSLSKLALKDYFEINYTNNMYLFQLGPFQSKMNPGKAIYKSDSNYLAYKMNKIIESKKGGVYYMPNYWRYLIRCLKLFF